MIFTNAESYYILFILTILFYSISLLSENCKNKDNYFYYICNSYNPTRKLMYEKEICKKYKDTFLSKAFNENSNIQEIQTNMEALIAEFIINLVNRTENINDPYIKIKFETKIYRILQNYIKCYDFDKEENIIEIDTFKFLLVSKIIDILSEVQLDIYYVSKELRRLLNKNSYSTNIFDTYSEYRKKIDLNTDNLKLNLEEVEILYNILKIKV